MNIVQSYVQLSNLCSTIFESEIADSFFEFRCSNNYIP